MNVNKYRAPTPILLIASLFIAVAIYSAYEIIVGSKLFDGRTGAGVYNFVTCMIVGVGLPLRSKVAYYLFILGLLIGMLLGSAFVLISMLGLLDLAEYETQFISSVFFSVISLVLEFIAYRYMRSDSIREWYFAGT